MSETTDILSEGLPADIEKEFNDGMDAYRAKRGANARNMRRSLSHAVCVKPTSRTQFLRAPRFAWWFARPAGPEC